VLSNTLELLGFAGLAVATYIAAGLAPAIYVGSGACLFLGYSLQGVKPLEGTVARVRARLAARKA